MPKKAQKNCTHVWKFDHYPLHGLQLRLGFKCIDCGKTVELRPEVTLFAIAMEVTLEKHDEAKGDSWKTCDIGYLVNKLIHEEAGVELDSAYRLSDWKGVAKESVDVANISMMIRHRAKEIAGSPGTLTREEG